MDGRPPEERWREWCIHAAFGDTGIVCAIALIIATITSW